MNAAAPAPLAVVAVFTKSLKLLGTSHSENLMAMFAWRTPKMRL